jgi:hypothetical protein
LLPVFGRNVGLSLCETHQAPRWVSQTLNPTDCGLWANEPKRGAVFALDFLTVNRLAAFVRGASRVIQQVDDDCHRPSLFVAGNFLDKCDDASPKFCTRQARERLRQDEAIGRCEEVCHVVRRWRVATGMIACPVVRSALKPDGGLGRQWANISC